MSRDCIVGIMRAADDTFDVLYEHLHARLNAHIAGVASAVVEEFVPRITAATRSDGSDAGDAMLWAMRAEVRRRCDAELTRIVEAVSDDRLRSKVLDDAER